MSVATQHTPQYFPLPADVRACDVRPAQWWDLGDEGNAVALKHCNACPFKASCKLPTGKPEDQIVAGIAYGNHGKRLRICDTCGFPMQRGCYRGNGTGRRCDGCRSTNVAVHHERIAELRALRYSYEYIGRTVGVSEGMVRHYWTRHENSLAVAA